MKTPFCSYCLNGIPKGCKYCVKGQKLVLFISGICKRNCWYCSLSEKRKNVDKIWANEKECKNIKDMIKEAEDSRALGAGVTGGDPLLFVERTLKYVKALRKKFGKKFHIHIYFPTKFISESNMKKLSKHIDEARIHPEFLINGRTEDIEKIKLARKYWRNLGIELPLLPDKKKEILSFILKVGRDVDFVNLNELELSETNCNLMTKKYKLKEGGYVVSGSKEAGLWILKELEKRKIRLKIHLCTADLKNQFQFKNRLLRHKIDKNGRRTSDGTVVYLKHKNKIISETSAKKLLKKGKKVFRVEEYPTVDGIEVEREEI